MATIRTGASPEAVLQGARHVLFVEGTQDSLDVTVLHELLTPKLRVAPLGQSFSLRSVATALHPFHPDYWFIIDRDDWDDTAVNASWAGFPDPTADNLLIWRRKELESYFLEPAWVCNSRYRKEKASPAVLERWLAKEADKLLWLEAANRVLIARRNQVKRSKGELLHQADVEGCTRAEVLDRLVASPLLAELVSATTAAADPDAVRDAFEREVALLSGGRIPLAWGTGRWRDLMSAKATFRTMVNQWFIIPDLAKGGTARLTGRAAERALAVELLKHHQQSAPADLQDLKHILAKVI